MVHKVICRTALARTRGHTGRILIIRSAVCSAQEHLLRDCRHGLQLVARNRNSTAVLAHYFATVLQPGDCYLLHGEVGSGKSFFRCVTECSEY